jgi:hypothetical protein
VSKSIQHFKLSDLPMRTGFQFVGITTVGKVECEVRVNGRGHSYFTDANGNIQNNLRGWVIGNN